MKKIKWILAAIIILGLANYQFYQAWGIWGVIGFLLWCAAVVVILAFLGGASFKELDENTCDYGHKHIKGEECPQCTARVTGRFVTKL